MANYTLNTQQNCPTGECGNQNEQSSGCSSCPGPAPAPGGGNTVRSGKLAGSNSAMAEMPWACLKCATVGEGGTVHLKYKWRGYSAYQLTAQCISLPLKSGGRLSLAFNQFPGLTSGSSQLASGEGGAIPSAFDVLLDGWMTGGQGGMFSFLPYLNTSSTPSPQKYTRMAATGTVEYEYIGSGTGVTYFEPANPLSFRARRSNVTKELTEYNYETREYFVYGTDDGHALPGRVLRHYDRNGNERLFHYSARTGSPPTYFYPILRKITGDIANIVPYFQYGGSGNEQYRPSPIKKIFLYDQTGETGNRTVYFDYDGATDPTNVRINRITYPNGCVRQYELIDDAAGYHPTIRKEVDPEGYTSYFQYENFMSDSRALTRTVEAEGRVAYYDYFPSIPTTNETRQIFAGRNPVYYKYDAASDGADNFAELRRLKDVLGNTSYYVWTGVDVSNSFFGNRLARSIQPSGNTTYFEYNTRNAPTAVIRPADSATTQYTYEPNGLDLHKMVGPRDTVSMPVVTYYSYDSKGNRTKVVDALGNITQWSFDSAGRARKEQDARGNTSYFNYNSSNGDMQSAVDASGSPVYFRYNAYRAVLREVGPRWRETGNYADFTTYHTYDSLDKLHKTIDALKGEIYFDYDSRGDLVGFVDQRDTVSTYRYNGLRLMVKRSVQDSTGAIVDNQYFKYDKFKNRTHEMDPLGNWTYYFYDERDRTTSTRDAIGNRTEFYYDNVDDRTKMRNPKQFTTYYFYDTLNRQKAQRDALANSTYFFYDKASNRTHIRDPRLYTTYFFYDALDRQNASRDALAQHTYFFYDAVSNLRLVRDSRLNSAYFFYDELNRQKSQRDALGQSSYFFYDAASNLTKARNARLNTSYFFYDQLNRQRTQRDSLGNHTYFYYDATSNLTHAKDARLNTAYFFYDALSRQHANRNAVGNMNYFYYDAASNLRKSRDPLLNTTYYFYDQLNRQKTQRDALGNHTYFFYDANSNIQKVRDARLNTSYFAYDELDRLSTQRNALANYTYFGYDENSNLSMVRNARLFITRYFYDELNRSKCVNDAIGNNTYFFYDSVSNLTKTRDSRLNTTYFIYDALNRVRVGRDAQGNKTYFAYDSVGNQSKIQDARLNTSYFTYDALNRPTLIRDALQRSTMFAYDSVGNQTRVIGPTFGYGDGPFGGQRYGSPWYATYFEYDTVNRLSQVIDRVGQAVRFGYDEASNRRKIQEPAGNTTYFHFDELNRPKDVLNADDKFTYFFYDQVGNQSKIRDARLNYAYFFYDAVNRPSCVRNALSDATYFFYDSVGNQTRVRDPRGNNSYFSYDELNRLHKAADAQYNSAYFVYDSVGNRTRSISPRGFNTDFRYDSLNRLNAVVDALNGTAYFGYDQVGNTVKAVDALQRNTYFQYDALSRLLAVTDPLSQNAYFIYDDDGSRVTEFDPLRHGTAFHFDPERRLTRITDALGVNSYFAYNANSNLHRTTDNNGESVYYAYDSLNRRTRTRYPGENQYFTYDVVSNLTKTGDSWGNTYFAYDPVNRLHKRNTPRGDTVYYQYDAGSNLIGLFYPQGTDSAYYAYDSVNRLQLARSPQDNLTYYRYDADSNVKSTDWGNGSSCAMTYDNVDRITSFNYRKSTSSNLAYFIYGRDVAGRIRKLNREVGFAVYYSYDTTDRLTSELWIKTSDLSQIYAFSYNYDAGSNRTKMRREAHGVEFENAYYFYDAANELRKTRKYLPSSLTTYYQYDLNGALLKAWDGTNATYFEYADNQLVSKITPPPGDGNPWEFFYDASLNRYKIDRGGSISFLLWNGLNVMEERDQGGGLLARYTYGTSRVPGIASNIEIFVPGIPDNTYYLLMDSRGTVHKLYNQSETEVGTRYYDAFGRILGETGSWPIDMAYQANWLTVQVGAKWYGLSRFRLYDSDSGRFLSRDFLPSMNKYVAFGQDPVNRVDPTGLETQEECEQRCKDQYEKDKNKQKFDKCMCDCGTFAQKAINLIRTVEEPPRRQWTINLFPSRGCNRVSTINCHGPQVWEPQDYTRNNTPEDKKRAAESLKEFLKDLPQPIPPGSRIEYLLKQLDIDAYTKDDVALGLDYEKGLWRCIAYQRAGIDPRDWQPQEGYRSQREISLKAYEYYALLYMRNPKKYLWPGLAKVAGASVHFGLQQSEREKGDWFGATPNFPINWIQVQLLMGQKEIFDDLMWEYEVYDKFGISALENFYSHGLISKEGIRNWRYINSDDPKFVRLGNLGNIVREQRDALGPIYDALNSKDSIRGPIDWYTEKRFSAEAMSMLPQQKKVICMSIINGKVVSEESIMQPETFKEYDPNGNWFEFDDRMSYIREVIYRSWTDLPEWKRTYLVRQPLERIIQIQKGKGAPRGY